MNFNDDIFISYAHIDNLSLDTDSDGWVSQLHRALSIRVAQILGEKPEIWRDEKLGGNDAFDEVILGRLQGAAVLVSVLTPRYVKSEWCTLELSRFCEATETTGGLVVRQYSAEGQVEVAKERVFKVLKTPVELEEHPEVIRGLRGYLFFKTDPVSGRVREFDQVYGREERLEFLNQLNDLAQDIASLLQLMESDSPDPLPPKGTIYLAPTTSDVREYYDQIRRDLLGHGYRVLPDRELPLEHEQLEAYIRDCLQQAQLSVHLIGARYGLVAEGSSKSMVELQNDLAIEQDSRADFSRLVWIPDSLAPDDHRQAAFLDALRADPRIAQGADLLESSPEDLNTQIHELLQAPAIDGSRKLVTPGDEALVYLICEPDDFTAAAKVASALVAQGQVVELPRFDGSAATLRQDHEAKLTAAQGVLIYYGRGNELWLHRKVRELRRSAGLGRSVPLRASAVLVAPPASERSGWQQLDVGHIISQGEEFTADLLVEFLSDLNRRAVG